MEEQVKDNFSGDGATETQVIRLLSTDEVGLQLKRYRKNLCMSRRVFCDHVYSLTGYRISTSTLVGWESGNTNDGAITLIVFALDMISKECGSRISGMIRFYNKLA